MPETQIKTLLISPKDYEAWYRQFENFFNAFLVSCPETHQENYQTSDWQKSVSSVLRMIYVQKRYDSGVISVALDQGKIVAFSACYEFKNKLFYLGSRSCVLPGYEAFHISTTLLIPAQQEYLKSVADYGFISFNLDDYSQRLRNSFKRREKWTASKVKRHSGLEYRPFHFIEDRTFLVNGCQQHVAYCSFSSTTSDEDFMMRIS